jgi:hypothetical protein
MRTMLAALIFGFAITGAANAADEACIDACRAKVSADIPDCSKYRSSSDLLQAACERRVNFWLSSCIEKCRPSPYPTSGPSRGPAVR